MATATLGATFFEYTGRSADFATRVSKRMPFGSPTAKMTAFTSLAESFIFSRGNILQAVWGGVLGWLSLWVGQAIQTWAENSPPGSFARDYIARGVHGVTGVGEQLPGMRGNPPLAALMGGIYGFVVGCLGEPGKSGRPLKILGSVIQHALRRLIAVWASERVLDAADKAPTKQKVEQIPSGLDKWKRGQHKNVVLNGQKLPPKDVLETHGKIFPELTEWEQKTFVKLQKDGTDHLHALFKEVSLPAELLREHELFLSSMDAAYNPVVGRKSRHSVDLEGESMVRIKGTQFQALAASPEALEIDHLCARIRSDVNRTHIVGDDERLMIYSGYRRKMVRPTPKEDPEAKDPYKEWNDLTCRFDDEVNLFLAHHMRGTRVTDRKKPAAVGLDRLCQALTKEQAIEVVQRLILGKIDMSFDPLVRYFSNEKPPPEDSEERAELEREIMTGQWDRLIHRLNEVHGSGSGI